MAINFTLNGEEREESSVSPTKTVLEYLRENRTLTGTKEGCAEGDCGACTVVVVRPGTQQRVAVNSCLLALGQIDGAEVVTVEGLSDRDGELEAVQQAIVETDGDGLDGVQDVVIPCSASASSCGNALCIPN